MSNLSSLHFHDKKKAYEYVEARLWPQGAVCPHCGAMDRVGKLNGKTTRVGLWKCYECRKPFTVKIGTIFEDSKVPMRLWLQAMHLVAGSKKGISSNQLHRILGVTLKTAWFMSHRIREAIRDASMDLFGGDGGEVQADETYIGRIEEKAPKARGAAHKMRVVSLLDKRTGKTRSIYAPGMVPNEISAMCSRECQPRKHPRDRRSPRLSQGWQGNDRTPHRVPRRRQLSLSAGLQHQCA